MAEISDLVGLWRRTLLDWPGRESDVTTVVHWLQGPTYYADLRQPKDRPSFSKAYCLRDLTNEHLVWLAAQEGFAGTLTFDGAHFVWGRDLDIQPTTDAADAGRLWFEGDLLVEVGRDVAYLEHWRAGAKPGSPTNSAAMSLQAASGYGKSFVVRVDEHFMYARSRAAALPHGKTLLECIQTAGSLALAQDMADCEISFGRITPRRWTIEASSLPYREGEDLRISMLGDDNVAIEDFSPAGQPYDRLWRLIDFRGDVASLTQDMLLGTDG